MGTHYNQLQLSERCEIYRLKADGKSLRQIGLDIGRSPSTVLRELRRNSKDTKAWSKGYLPERAEELAQRRRRWDCRFKLARQPALRVLVRNLLAMGWSPQQISGRLALEKHSTRISHESIYRYVYHRSAQKDYWHKLLPMRKNRRGRLRRGGLSPVHFIKKRVSIDDRPAHVDNRRQSGHWEADLMCFSKYGKVILMAHERTSRILLSRRMDTKAALPTRRCLQAMLAPLPKALRRTITFDNGSEFADHHVLRDNIGIKTYFCDSHSPWQKGGVENAIGRMRRQLPRKTELAKLSPRQLDTYIAKHNSTPRRCLNYRTPAEVFWHNQQLLRFKRESTWPPPRP